MGGLKLILSWFPIGTHQILPLIASLGWPGGRSPTPFTPTETVLIQAFSRSRSVLKKGLGKKVGMNNFRALFQLVMFGLFVSARVESELMRAHSVIWWGVYFFWTVRLPFFLASFKFFFFQPRPVKTSTFLLGSAKPSSSAQQLQVARVLSFHTKWTPQNFLKVCNNKQPNWSRLHFNGSLQTKMTS